MRLQSQATQQELLEERLTNDNVYIKGELSQQARIVRQSLEGGPKLSQTAKNNTAAEMAADHRFDAFYLSFENHFRGRRSDIKRPSCVLFAVSRSNGRGPGGSANSRSGSAAGGEWLELTERSVILKAGVLI